MVSDPNHVQEAIDYYFLTMFANTWSRYHTTGAVAPYMSSSQLNLQVVSAGQAIGIMQRITNLTVGAVYEIKLEVAGQLGAYPTAYIYSGDILQTSGSLVDSTFYPYTFQFTATTNTHTFVLDYTYLNTTSVLLIDSISISSVNITPSNVIQLLGDGQAICDLYEDEDIPLTLSVDDFKNVAEQVQSYSKAFNLPATKRNNRIFDDMFEITRTAQGNISFNPYYKTECVLKQDGFILFKGYLRMLDINDKDGEISYNVNLYSEVVALADILEDRTFSDLNFTELNHDYQKTNIERSWNDSGTGITYLNPSTSGYRDAYTTLRYPYVDWNHQIIPSDGTVGVLGMPVLPNLEAAFRPFIQLKYLINRIFEATPFTWESSFFDSEYFEKLYMDFNWGAGNAPNLSGISTFQLVGSGVTNVATTSFTNLKLALFSFFGPAPPNYDLTNNTITATVTNENYDIDYNYQLHNTSGSSATIECHWLHTIGGVAQPPINFMTQTIPAGDSWQYAGDFSLMLQPTETLEAQFKASVGSAIQQTAVSAVSNLGAVVSFNVSSSNMLNNMILHTLRGELGQWDFLKGIMTMFNLVSLPDEDNPNNIKFETYSDIFNINTSSGSINDLTLSSRSIQHDWTDRIDVAEMKLKPLTDLNKDTIFKFAEDEEDFCFMEYKRQVGGHLYGSKKFDASLASNGLATVLRGTKEIVVEPFAATIIKPLETQYPDFITPAIYASGDNEKEGFDNMPRILYNNGIKPTLASYYIPPQNGATSTLLSNYLQFSHLTEIPTVASTASVTVTQDSNFGQCQLPSELGIPTPRNLYGLYWSPYYNELYNPDTRLMTIKVNLSPSIINTFKFNDTVMIKNREFRVNKIDYKPNDLATVEFILIP